MDRFLELYSDMAAAKWALFVEFWWVWVIVLVPLALWAGWSVIHGR